MKKISFILLLIAILILFRKFFLPGQLVFGDAPYLYTEGLKEFVNFPPMWTARNNVLGGVNLFLWLTPIMTVYGALGTFLNFPNDLILRILFYIPSLVFGFIGIYLFVKHLKFSTIVQFISILIYLVNTYYLLIIDGGQVGVVLSYGMFPLVLYLLIRSADNFTTKNFLLALIASFAMSTIDFRITGICFFLAFVLKIPERKFSSLLITALCLLGLSSYWIIPSLKLSSGGLSSGISGLRTTSLLNTLLLSAPNWPANEFGKIIPPYFYFMIIPLFVFLPLFIIKEKKVHWLVFLFLFFAFLAKGESDPLGSFYSTVVNTKIGSVFRDSTKFFIPLILLGGILIGRSVEEISKFIKKDLYKNLFVAGISFIFFTLVWQAPGGKLNGVLGKSTDDSNFQRIYQLISKENSFSRSLWFPEKSPFALQTEKNPAVDARDLVNFRPFATMNVGTGDKFNFINNERYLDWFSLLGIKYLVLSGNPRTTSLDESDQKDWDRLLNLFATDNRLKKSNIQTNFPVYENPDIHPSKFFVENTFLVIGSEDVYEKIEKIDKDFSIGNSGFLFLEDGRLDPLALQTAASTSATLLFNNKEKTDLKMSFLQKFFISPSEAVSSQWAVRGAGNYLEWKYELLINEIKSNEFDFNKGIAFSSRPNEEIKYNLSVPEDGNYYLVIRTMKKDGSNELVATFNNSEYRVKTQRKESFEWFESEIISLKKGINPLIVRSTDGFQVLNTVALIPVSAHEEAKNLTENFINYFQVLNIDNELDKGKIVKQLQIAKWRPIDSLNNTKPGWIIFTDAYNENWTIDSKIPSLPFYSMMNGFFIDPKYQNVKMVFTGEIYLRWGLYFTSLTLLIIVIGVIWRISVHVRKNTRNN